LVCVTSPPDSPAGTTEAAWRAATSGVDAVVVPELEIADLSAALDENAEQAVVDYVASGGTLIVQGNATRAALLVFGFGLVATAGAPGTLSDTLSPGTRFAFGPPTLPQLSDTTAISGLPGIYTGAAAPVVGRASFGAGRIVHLGWDWFNAAPLGTEDGGWNEVLRRAVLERRAPQRRVAVYADAAFTDVTSPAPGAEARNVQASLVQADMLVSRVAGTADGVFSALGTRRPSVDALVVPELSADLGAAMTVVGRNAVRDFVSAGGTLVVLGGLASNANPMLFLNQVFGFSTAPQAAGAPGSVRAAGFSGSLFSGALATLPHPGVNSGIAGLPAGSRSIYESGGVTTVASIRGARARSTSGLELAERDTDRRGGRRLERRARARGPPHAAAAPRGDVRERGVRRRDRVAGAGGVGRGRGSGREPCRAATR
jgi:hypothetical protein